MNDKIYVGVSPWSFSRDEFKELFEVPEENRPVKVMVDRMRGRSRGFGFIESKTNSAMKFLINGAKNGETGAYICVTEPAPKIISNLQTFDSFDDSLVNEGKLNIFDLHIIDDRLGIERLDGTYTAKDMETLLGAFEDIVEELKVTRLVIDTTAFCHRLPDKKSIQHFIFRLSKILRQYSCLLMMIPETIVDSNTRTYSIFAISEPEANEVYDMGNIIGQGDLLQNLKIVSHDSLTHLYLEKARTHERLLKFDEAVKIYKIYERNEDVIRVKVDNAKYHEKLLEFDAAAEIYKELMMDDDVIRVREKARNKVSQTVVHGDQVTKTEIKDSVINRSNVGGSSSKAEELREAKSLFEEGLIDDDEFKQMKKEILGK